MRPLNEIIIHCADTPNGKEFHASDINEWHKQKGWREIGYHFVITIEGTLEEGGRTIDEIGAQCEGDNAYSIGICLIGKDKFTVEQWNTLANIVTQLKAQWNIRAVTGHYEHESARKQGKGCPNFDVPAWLSNGMMPATANIYLKSQERA